MATPAPCCLKALRDATTHWPSRNKASDGIMGDAAHQKTKSDHNDGNAFDLTHDPRNGVDCATLSRQVINDRRVTYVIFNREIYNRARAAEGWRKYSGENPHDHHMHVSIRSDAREDLAAWPWSNGSGGGGGTRPTPPTPGPSGSHPYPGTAIRQGSSGSHVRAIQQRLRDRGYTIMVDGIFGPKTHATVVAFQTAHGLTRDGIVGPITWGELFRSTSSPRGSRVS